MSQNDLVLSHSAAVRLTHFSCLGIVSYGNKECTGEAAYTRVAHYLEWIEQKMSGDSVNPVLPENFVPVHVESGILSEVNQGEGKLLE